MAHQEVNFPSYKISKKKRSEYKIGKIYVIMEIQAKTPTRFDNIIGVEDYLLQKKGSDSSHELNLACCQLEGRHLPCIVFLSGLS